MLVLHSSVLEQAFTPTAVQSEMAAVQPAGKMFTAPTVENPQRRTHSKEEELDYLEFAFAFFLPAKHLSSSLVNLQATLGNTLEKCWARHNSQESRYSGRKVQPVEICFAAVSPTTQYQLGAGSCNPKINFTFLQENYFSSNLHNL